MGKDEHDFEEFDETLESVSVTDDEGNELEFYIIDSIEHMGVSYLLVIDSEDEDDEECEATILKKVSQDGEDFVFVLVEDDIEFNTVAAVFEDSTEDYDIEY